MRAVKIESDFKDMYDLLSDNESNIVYKRYLCDSRQRGTALKFLRGMGVKTIEVKQVSQFLSQDGQIVVYVDPKAHNGNGKKLMTVDEAMQCNFNCIASKFIVNDVKTTIKYIHIGKRRFQMQFIGDYSEPFKLGKLVDIKELSQGYNRLIGLPIYSIDYINVGNEMIATDFNEVERLDILGMGNYISLEDIINETHDAIIAYNKN